jgi:hypothetical protein
MNGANGTFTITLTGVTGSVTGTAYWVRGPVGVILELPALIGTSNSTAATLTGLPVEVRPARAQVTPARIRNAGAVSSGTLRVETDGTITLSPDQLFGLFSALLTKGIESATISYHMKA